MVREAVSRYLLPALLPELRGRLAARARETVACMVSDTLWDLASKAPLKVRPRPAPPRRPCFNSASSHLVLPNNTIGLAFVVLGMLKAVILLGGNAIINQVQPRDADALMAQGNVWSQNSVISHTWPQNCTVILWACQQAHHNSTPALAYSKDLRNIDEHQWASGCLLQFVGLTCYAIFGMRLPHSLRLNGH